MKKKFSIIAKALISVSLAVLTAFLHPTQIVAATAEDKYVSEMYIVTEEQKKQAEEDGYVVVPNPLYKNLLDEKNGASATYIAYKTTGKAEEAITDIRLMNMNGGWSFAEYEDYLESMKKTAKESANRLWDAILEFRAEWATDPTRENVKLAYDYLNLIYDDDVTGKDGAPMRLGDLLLDESKITGPDDETYTTLFMESNASVLQLIYNAMAFVTSRNADGKTFLDVLSEDDGTLIELYVDDSSLDDTVAIMMNSVDSVRNAIRFYESSNVSPENLPYGETVETYLDSISAEDASLWITGATLVKILKNVSYYGFDGSLETLYDLFAAENDSYANEDYMYSMLRPLAGAMTEGFRCVQNIGLTNVFAIAGQSVASLRDSVNTVCSDEKYTSIAENGVSAFYNVNRMIYKDHAVAMTNAALRKNAEGDTSWLDTVAEDSEQRHTYYIDAIVCAAATGAAVGLSVIAGVAIAKLITNGGILVTIQDSFLGDFIFCTLGLANPTITFITRALLNSIGVLISIGLLIVTIILFLKAREVSLVYADYTEIPGMICDCVQVFDPKTGEEIEGERKYVYYEGVTSPYPDEMRTKSLFAEDHSSAQKLPENKRNVMDIYNWSLRGNRQWLCLYTTKDRRAGFPIESASLILNDKYSQNISVNMFGTSNKYGYSLSTIYNYSLTDENSRFIEGASSDSWGKGNYIHYSVDVNALYGEDTTQSFLDKVTTVVGSAVGNGGAWVMSIVTFGIGIAGGMAVGRKTSKKHDGES